MEPDKVPRHIPVLHASESEDSTVLALLKPAQGDVVIDVTLGLGGHAEGFIAKLGASGVFVGIDADEDNLATARAKLATSTARITFIHDNFRNVSALLLPQADIIFADLGVSSTQLDEEGRGFTFRTDAPLDLRFDRSRGMTAAEFLGSAREKEIVFVLSRLGEVPGAGRLASRIYKEARTESIDTTHKLRRIVEGVYGYKAPSFLPQIFQALRMHINDELGALHALLEHAPKLLKAGGRLGIISYHSLEDRAVKHSFRELTTPVKNPQTGAIQTQSSFELITRKAVVPSEEEIGRNPRSRSAKFRVIRKRM